VEEGTSAISEQTSFAVNKLRELNEKLEYKRQALSSIQNAPKPDKKVTLFVFKVVAKSFHLSLVNNTFKLRSVIFFKRILTVSKFLFFWLQG
jgi:hypothetical protein